MTSATQGSILCFSFSFVVSTSVNSTPFLCERTTYTSSSFTFREASYHEAVVAACSIASLRGVAWLLPAQTRDDWRGTAQAMGQSLRRLLFGRLLGMASEGIATWLLLQIWGVPMAALLGLLTGLLAFLPNIGAPISGSLMILVGFSGGVHTGVYCIVVYALVQIIDGNVVVPMVAKRTADLAPALVLGAQLIFGVLFGLLGLILAVLHHFFLS